MSHSNTLPLFERGLGRIRLALKSTFKGASCPSKACSDGHACWRDDLLQPVGPAIVDIRTLGELGYSQSPHASLAVDTITGVAAVHRLSTPECVTLLGLGLPDLRDGASERIRRCAVHLRQLVVPWCATGTQRATNVARVVLSLPLFQRRFQRLLALGVG